ncbi:Tyrosine-protein kinase CSK [Holothuria leucospilota]|uniref:Tyrosine-protein kinase CSK n=1 Tax=Holothuria leucospilota TaxID=206669 RepID=A0A9Q1C4B1_HOLLE|nr:Tyrosine-protein kinase CSK [Holothuria leucospilota]
MGTVTSNDGNRCVISLTVAENALRSQTVHWEEFVRNSLDLPKNQHLVNVEGIYFRNEIIYLVQEYLNCETLFVRLQRCISSPNSTTLMMMATPEVIRHVLGILEGLQILHSFGTACDMNQFAPEALYENKYTKASDVWSTAVVIWEILSGHAPFGSDEQAITDKAPSNIWPDQYKTLRNDLLFDCWQLDCSLRPSVQALWSSFVEISHSLVNEIHCATSRDVTEGYIPMSRYMDNVDNA